MHIVFDGMPLEVPGNATLASLVARDGTAGIIAVAVNGQLVARSAWPTTYLERDDHVEVIRALGPG